MQSDQINIRITEITFITYLLHFHIFLHCVAAVLHRVQLINRLGQ